MLVLAEAADTGPSAALRAGAAGFLAKDTPADELIAAIRASRPAARRSVRAAAPPAATLSPLLREEAYRRPGSWPG